jgi:two-component system chemotaxis response regulator CheB
LIRVLIVDDDPSARRSLEDLFAATPDFQVVGSVGSGEDAIEVAKRLRPNLISLDAVLDGLSPAQVVREVLSTHPVPVVLISDAPQDTAGVFEALTAGALDFVRRPLPGDARSAVRMLETLRALSRVKVQWRSRRATHKHPQASSAAEVIVIASSTGGPAPLQILLSQLPSDFSVPLVIAQHLISGFENGLAAWLSLSSRIKVRIARDRDVLLPGIALIARPDTDVVIVTRSALELRPTEPGGFHPSADELFASTASVFGAGTLAVVLSGIGRGGTEGAHAVVDAGGRVFSQDRESSAVFGMPAEIARQGLASVIASPEGLARAICEAVTGCDRAEGRV